MTLKLFYKSFGNGKPLVILHGLFGSGDNWTAIAKVLAQNYTVYLIDLRNHGDSPHASEMSYELMAQDVYHFFEAEKIQNAILIGHSMGGKTAMVFAALYPQMLEKLIVIDIAPKTYENRHQTIINALLNVQFSEEMTRKDIETQLEKSIPEFGIRQFLLKNLKRSTNGFSWKIGLAEITNNYSALSEFPMITPVSVKSLFIRGGHSDYISVSDEHLIYTLFYNAEIETINSAGHWVHAEKPHETVERLQSFISG